MIIRKRRFQLIYGLIWGVPVGSLIGIFADWIEQSIPHLLVTATLAGVYGVFLIVILGRMSGNQ